MTTLGLRPRSGASGTCVRACECAQVQRSPPAFGHRLNWASVSTADGLTSSAPKGPARRFFPGSVPPVRNALRPVWTDVVKCPSLSGHAASRHGRLSDGRVSRSPSRSTRCSSNGHRTVSCPRRWRGQTRMPLGTLERQAPNYGPSVYEEEALENTFQVCRGHAVPCVLRNGRGGGRLASRGSFSFQARDPKRPR